MKKILTILFFFSITFFANAQCPTATANPNAEVICSGDNTGISLSSNVPGTTFSWTYVTSNNATGASPGNGNIINQTIVSMGTTTGNVTYTITPNANGCNGNPIDVTVTINPIPTITVNPTAQTICSGQTTGISLSSDIPGTTFSWTCITTGVSGASNGSGDFISQVLTATGSATGNVTYTITPEANGCSGSPITVSVNVNPAPVVTATPNGETIYSGQSTGIVLSSNVSGTTFSHTFTTSGVSGASPGTGNVISQVLFATGSSNGTVTYIITPTANGCTGNTINVIVTVIPIPTATATPSSQTICSGGNSNILLTSDKPRTSFSWTATQSNVMGATSGTGDTINQTLYTTATTTGTVIYTVTPYANGQTGNPISVTVTVNPLPTATSSVYFQTILSGENTEISLSGDLPGTTFDWTFVATDVTGASNGSGNSIYQTLSTAGITPGSVTYTATPTSNGCIGNPIQITVYILYVPGIGDGFIGTDGSGNVTQPYLLDTLLSDSNYTCEWTLDGVAFKGTTGVENITTNQYYATSPGTYCVTATNTTTGFRSVQGCATVTTQVLSNAEFNTLKLSFSPNPVNDILNISSKEILKKVTVFNTLGQTVYSNDFNDLNTKIDLSNLVSGNYFVKVASDSKQNVVKIIKK